MNTMSLYDSLSNCLTGEKNADCLPKDGGVQVLISYSIQVSPKLCHLSHPAHLVCAFAGQNLKVSINNQDTIDHIFKDMQLFTEYHPKCLNNYRRLHANFVMLCKQAVQAVNKSEHAHIQLKGKQTFEICKYDPRFQHFTVAFHHLCDLLDIFTTCIFKGLRHVSQSDDAQAKTEAAAAQLPDEPFGNSSQRPKPTGTQESLPKAKYASGGADVYGRVIGVNQKRQRVQIEDANGERFTFPKSAVKYDDSNRDANEERMSAVKSDTSPRPYLLKTKPYREPPLKVQKEKYREMTSSPEKVPNPFAS